MINNAGFKPFQSRAFVVALLASVATPALAAGGDPTAHHMDTRAGERIVFDVRGQPLAAALSDFARQAHLTTLYDYDGLEGIQATSLHGEYTREEALRLLLVGTQCEANIRDGVIYVQAPSRPQPASAPDSDGSAQTVTQAAPLVDTPAPPPSDEIVVTGSRIRGRAPAGSNVITIDRSDIEKGGFGTTAQVLAALPQNFGGGPTEISAGGLSDDRGAGDNAAFYGSGVDLRGLGADSTLTLINGRRLPPGPNAAFADISSIPASAIERIEVLPDGASAIYGSDAIGGVVNIVLRRDFDGAETDARVGTVTSGNSTEQRYSATLGGVVGSAHLLGSYEYYNRTALAAADRAFFTENLTPFGGSDFRNEFSNPGNITDFTTTFPIPAGQDGKSLTPADFTAGPPHLGNDRAASDILPDVTRHSAFGVMRLDLGPDTELQVDARFSHRAYDAAVTPIIRTLRVPSTNPFFVNPFGVPHSSVNVEYSFIDDFGPEHSSGTTDAYGGSIALNQTLRGGWEANVSVSDYVDNNHQAITNVVNTPALALALADSNPTTAFNPFGDGSHTNPATLEAIRGYSRDHHVGETRTLTAQLTGDLFTLPGGSAKIALGGEVRNEQFDFRRTAFQSAPSPLFISDPTSSRNVDALFAELSLPLLSASNNVPLVHDLDVSLAVRTEDYDDFGRTTNPHVGVAWTPVEGLTARATYGTSFKAPGLRDLVVNNRALFGFGIDDPSSPTGTTNTVIITGNNPDLRPEKADTYTAGFDFQPPAWQGFRANLTWFRTDIHDRLIDPGPDAISALVLPQYAGLINRTPDLAEVTALFADPDFTNIGGFAPSDIQAIADFRLQNLALLQIEGVDLSITQVWEVFGGQANVSLDATHFLRYAQATSVNAPFVSVLDTFDRPTDTRLRAGAGWRGDRLGFNAFVNYVDDYRDNTVTPAVPIKSWTTVDASISYDLQAGAHSATLALSVQNLFDKDPPFVNNAVGVGFDPANASPQGRFVAIELRKHW